MIKKESIFRTVLIVIFFIFLIFWLATKPIQLTLVSGHSMDTTLHNGEFLIMTKGKIKKGDIVTFNAKSAWKEDDLNRDFIKRVVAVPNDELTIHNNKLYVNDRETVDFNNKLVNNIGEKTFKLKSNEYFVCGDNTGQSHDSLYRLLQGYDKYTVSGKLLKYKTSNIENKNER